MMFWSILFWVLGAMNSAIADVLEHRYDRSIFNGPLLSELIDEYYWNPHKNPGLWFFGKTLEVGFYGLSIVFYDPIIDLESDMLIMAAIWLIIYVAVKNLISR